MCSQGDHQGSHAQVRACFTKHICNESLDPELVVQQCIVYMQVAEKYNGRFDMALAHTSSPRQQLQAKPVVLIAM